jgi:hypothetical protein
VVAKPLLDACQAIKSILGDSTERAGLFREGRTEPDISGRIDKGAELTVTERQIGGLQLEKFETFEPGIFKEAAK